jgi:hypothetical protein
MPNWRHYESDCTDVDERMVIDVGIANVLISQGTAEPDLIALKLKFRVTFKHVCTMHVSNTNSMIELRTVTDCARQRT